MPKILPYLAGCVLVSISCTNLPRSSPAPAKHSDPVIQKIVSEISEPRIAEIMRKLESFGTRNTGSDPSQINRGVGVARQWVFDQFQSYSPRLQVSFDTHQIPKGGRIYKDLELRNVVAILPGRMTQASNRWIVVSGHYDTVNLKDARGLAPEKAAELVAPGVSDDASGTACAMECARVLSRYEFDATLVFVAFAGEEQGLIGSHALARRLKNGRQEIEAVLNNDIIGNDVSGNGRSTPRRVLLFSEDPNDSASRQIARFVRATGARYYPGLSVDLIFRQDRFGRGGDHESFNTEGYAGVRFTTASENFTNQHSATDTFANASPRYAAKVIRLNAAAAAALALAPKPPVALAVPRRATDTITNTAGEAAAMAVSVAPTNTASLPGLSRGAGYDAVLRWEYPDPEPDLAGFVVVMRSTTAPDWQREFWAGNVREFTLKDTPIDQLVLGVKAVDRDGHESPVSAYVLPPRRRPATLEDGR